MLGDYYRYIAEFAQDQKFDFASEKAVESYKEGGRIAKE